MNQPRKIEWEMGDKGCWICTSHKNRRKKYPQMNKNGKVVAIHRVIWELNNGMIPTGYYICHKCDNTMCINPDHLFLGTPQQNAQDAVGKGRMGPHKLSKLDVETIIKLRAEGISQRAVAEMFGVDQSMISHITCIREWKNIDRIEARKKEAGK